MPAAQEHRAGPAPRQHDTQDGQWRVRVSEDPRHPSSYILYIKTPTRNLTLRRSAREIAELDRKLHGVYLSVPLPAISVVSSTPLQSNTGPKRAPHHTSPRLSSPASKSIGSATGASLSVTGNVAAPRRAQIGVDTSRPAKARNASMESSLTVLSNDPVFRQVHLWKNFIRLRTYDLECASAGRGISPVRLDISTSQGRERGILGSLNQKNFFPNDTCERRAYQEHTSSPMRAEESVLSKMRVSDFEMVCVLGIGSKSKVLLARQKSSSDLYALKVISKRRILAGHMQEHTHTEQAVLGRLTMGRTNPFVVKLWRIFYDAENTYLAMEFHPGGDLRTQLDRWGSLGDVRSRFYAAEIVAGVEGLHAAGVIHRNLKPEHIFIDRDGHIVLGGFGACKEFPRTAASRNDTLGITSMTDLPYWMKDDYEFAAPWQPHYAETTSSICGTAAYYAPEVVQGLPYSYGTDWWSFGTILYEMLTGTRPFDAENRSDMYDKILHDELRFPEDSAINQDTKSLIQELLERDPTLRLREPQIKRHSYFSMVDWADVYHKRLKPPYIPPMDRSNPSDTQNFEDVFLNMKPVVSDEVDLDTGQCTTPARDNKQEPESTDLEATDRQGFISTPMHSPLSQSSYCPVFALEGHAVSDRPDDGEAASRTIAGSDGPTPDPRTPEALSAAVSTSTLPVQRGTLAPKPVLPPLTIGPGLTSFSETTLQAIASAAAEVSESFDVLYRQPPSCLRFPQDSRFNINVAWPGSDHSNEDDDVGAGHRKENFNHNRQENINGVERGDDDWSRSPRKKKSNRSFSARSIVSTVLRKLSRVFK
ncbi:kinase-like domain-containing protein [Russula brevipes]|nr:kinase-like domain-containing protein [Russula brevipes]